MFNPTESTEEAKNLNSEALGKVQQVGEILATLEEKSTDDSSEEEDTTY
jgi:hypothetical protein